MGEQTKFASQKIFSRNFVAIHEIKLVLTFDKPVYLQLSILDLSKLLMNKFHYVCIGVKYCSRSKLLFTYTDSSAQEIETDDIYEDFNEDKGLFDFSDYRKYS